MMVRVKKEQHFASEADMCAAFIAALPTGWTAYAETAGWDILLSRDADGFQIGVQAKLKFNASVMAQVLETRYGANSAGPDCRAVLVPANEMGYETICDYIGITVVRLHRKSIYRADDPAAWTIRPDMPTLKHGGYYDQWHEFLLMKRYKLPEYVPDVTAGARGPVQLTRWKINAIKVCILLARNGYLLRSDFKHIGMDHRRWIAKDFDWLTIDHERKVYVAGPALPDLRKQHPRNWLEIEADFEKWAPPPPPLLQQKVQAML